MRKCRPAAGDCGTQTTSTAIVSMTSSLLWLRQVRAFPRSSKWCRGTPSSSCLSPAPMKCLVRACVYNSMTSADSIYVDSRPIHVIVMQQIILKQKFMHSKRNPARIRTTSENRTKHAQEIQDAQANTASYRLPTPKREKRRNSWAKHETLNIQADQKYSRKSAGLQFGGMAQLGALFDRSKAQCEAEWDLPAEQKVVWKTARQEK